MASYPPQAPALVVIGDVYCTQDEVITPSGTRPIGEVSWTYADMSRSWRSIPTWAVVCAIVGFFVVCAFSLLFLLAKEDRTEGWIQIVVQAPEFVHTTYVPVYNPQQVADYAARVNYARSLSAVAAASG